MDKKAFVKITLWMWGGLDILYFAWFILVAVSSSEIPFYTDIMASYGVAISYENNLPIYTAWASAILNISIAISGILLLFQKRVGIILCYIQFPWRILFVMPSIFFILWGLKTEFFQNLVWLAYLFIIITEVYKIYTLHKI